MRKLFVVIMSIFFVGVGYAAGPKITIKGNAQPNQSITIQFNLNDNRILENYEPQGYKKGLVKVNKAKKGETLSHAEIMLPEFSGQEGKCNFNLNYYGDKFVYEPQSTFCNALTFKLTQ